MKCDMLFVCNMMDLDRVSKIFKLQCQWYQTLLFDTPSCVSKAGHHRLCSKCDHGNGHLLSSTSKIFLHALHRTRKLGSCLVVYLYVDMYMSPQPTLLFQMQYAQAKGLAKGERAPIHCKEYSSES